MRSSPLATDLPIRPETWDELVNARKHADWAHPWTFSTGVGEAYRPGSPDSFLYVGGSPGLRVKWMRLGDEQERNAEASRDWMQNWQENNASPFWLLADRIERDTRKLAWTNVVKFDAVSRSNPEDVVAPSPNQARSVHDISSRALLDEILILRPKVILVAVSGFANEIAGDVIARLSLAERDTAPCDGRRCRHFVDSDGGHLVWVDNPGRKSGLWTEAVVEFVRSLRTSS